MGDSHEGKAMHPLLDKIYGKVFPRAEKSIRIVVLGSPGVGKTALIIRCLTNQFFNNYVPGKETAYRYTTSIGPKKINFEIMDSNGKNNALISYADAVVLVYSTTDRKSYEHVKNLIESVRKLNLNSIPIAVIANKIDQSKKRVVTKQDGESLSTIHKVKVFERSAAIPTEDMNSVFTEMYKLVQLTKKTRRDSDPALFDPASKMALKSIRRRSSSLDSNEFIKLVL
ncbi:ras-related and estrogen-regulated growth inhibitor-like [Hydractinia symbiolongicarpus]|uniref:ras-related and estrogen-regulated growth inhibitor-like n=1 Tax=Hydractinia symbiolongicarpus TaxID=13093 RepID=UPI0025501AE9|nr:ras-related and estrogen-regulated growth inhibitor-like [Hydractinia symbiolongicarpus]